MITTKDFENKIDKILDLDIDLGSLGLYLRMTSLSNRGVTKFTTKSLETELDKETEIIANIKELVGYGFVKETIENNQKFYEIN